MTSYTAHVKIQEALQDLLPTKRYVQNKELPELIRIKAAEFRLVILGALAELGEEGWEGDA